ncbi:MAG: hypothetical protein Kow0069_12260 [Promethearchaeota archaeon]
MAKHGAHWDLVRTLIVIGAIVGIVEAILNILSLNVVSILLAVVAIVICVIVLNSLGLLGGKFKLDLHWLVTLVLSIVLIVLGSWIGGVIMLIGAIVDLVDAL